MECHRYETPRTEEGASERCFEGYWVRSLELKIAQQSVVHGDDDMDLNDISFWPREPDLEPPGHWEEAHAIAHDSIIGRQTVELFPGAFLETPKCVRDLRLLPHVELVDCGEEPSCDKDPMHVLCPRRGVEKFGERVFCSVRRSKSSLLSSDSVSINVVSALVCAMTSLMKDSMANEYVVGNKRMKCCLFQPRDSPPCQQRRHAAPLPDQLLPRTESPSHQCSLSCGEEQIDGAMNGRDRRRCGGGQNCEWS